MNNKISIIKMNEYYLEHFSLSKYKNFKYIFLINKIKIKKK